MISIHNYYEELFENSKTCDSNKNIISKLYEVPNGEQLILAVSMIDKTRYLYFKIEKTQFEKLPTWRGISTELVQLREYSITDTFCALKQTIDSEDYIFETIIEDVVNSVVNLKANIKVADCIIKLLIKWRDFFMSGKDIVLSPERQQGLFGELLFLQDLIKHFGEVAVNFWTGCKNETHDYYIHKNAVEIKTTSTKAPYKIHISSEYQLDDKDVAENLFIRFYVLRKSGSDGIKLPELVDEIKARLKNNVELQKKYLYGLEEYGYFEATSTRYDIGYSIRATFSYIVKDNFPRIIENMLSIGVSNCTYDIVSDTCRCFEVSTEELMKALERKGG